MTEIEKLRKEIGSLDTKRGSLEQKQASTRERILELKAKRAVLLTREADGQSDVKGELRSLAAERRDLTDHDDDLVTALATVAASIDSKQRALVRAERSAVIAQLETEIRGLDALDIKVGVAIRALKESTASLFTACDAVARELHHIDSNRFDGGYAFTLKAAIRDAIQRAVINVDQASSAESPSFIESVKIKLRSACAQLAYESLDQTEITPGKNERLYKTQGWIGFRGVELAPGKIVALRSEEAAPHIQTGFLALIEEPALAV